MTKSYGGAADRKKVLGRGRRGNYLDPAAAAALYRRSLDATLSPHNGAVYRAGLADALAASGDVTGAMAEGRVSGGRTGTGETAQRLTAAAVAPTP